MKKVVFNVSEAAELLGCSVQTIRREIRRGKLHAAKVGNELRISKADLESYWRSEGGQELFDKEGEETMEHLLGAWGEVKMRQVEDDEFSVLWESCNFEPEKEISTRHAFFATGQNKEGISVFFQAPRGTFFVAERLSKEQLSRLRKRLKTISLGDFEIPINAMLNADKDGEAN